APNPPSVAWPNAQTQPSPQLSPLHSTSAQSVVPSRSLSMPSSHAVRASDAVPAEHRQPAPQASFWQFGSEQSELPSPSLSIPSAHRLSVLVPAPHKQPGPQLFPRQSVSS